MRQCIAALLALVLQAGTVSAQKIQVHGTVSYDDTPIVQAKVTEIDANHRILNHTLTDDRGCFVLNVTGGKTSLRITAPGMHKFTQKIGRNTVWRVNMRKDNTPDAPGKVRARAESTKLLVGHMNERAIPQLTWVEQLTDTTFALVVPVRMPNAVEEYPKGRKMTVKDFNGHIVAIGNCIEQATPEEGTPQSWDPFVRVSTNNSVDNESAFTTNDRDYFAYPRFSFTKNEMEAMIDNSKELACFAVDTARGDNYWLYYPSTTLARELQKILNRMLK